jgi:hypothetical protein
MTLINAISNKIIQRVMAIVKSGRPYLENYSKIKLELLQIQSFGIVDVGDFQHPNS